MAPPLNPAVRNSARVPPEHLVRLVRACEKTITGSAWCTLEDILLETGHPGHDPLFDGWCLTGPHGDVTAWAALTARGGPSLDCLLFVLPGADGPEGIARELLVRVLVRAGEVSGDGDVDLVLGGVLNGDPVVPRVAGEMGFTRRTTYTQCEIDLLRPPRSADPPEGGRIRPIGTAPDEVDAVYDIHLRTRAVGSRTLGRETFRHRIEQFRAARERGAGVCLLLEIAGKAAGYVLAQAGSGRGRIADMAVSPAFRNRGVGAALTFTALARLRELGCARAVLSLDSSRLRHQAGLHRMLAVSGERLVTQYARRLV